MNSGGVIFSFFLGVKIKTSFLLDDVLVLNFQATEKHLINAKKKGEKID